MAVDLVAVAFFVGALALGVAGVTFLTFFVAMDLVAVAFFVGAFALGTTGVTFLAFGLAGALVLGELVFLGDRAAAMMAEFLRTGAPYMD